MKFIKLIAVAFAALLIVACGNTPTVNTPPKPSPAPSNAATPAPQQDEVAAIREFYSDNCASCHQENGEGGTVKIEGKKLNVPALTKGHALGHTDEELGKQILEGGKGMPAFKDKMTREQVKHMIGFLRKEIQGGAKAASDTRADTVTADPGMTKMK